MSLKSKIEAVIYAAEEPVTLSQLAAIFAAEIPAAQTPVPVPSSPFEDAAEQEQLDVPFLAPQEPGQQIMNLDAAGTMQEAFPQPDEAKEDTTSPAAALTSPIEPIDAAELEAAAKRAARQRDREVREAIRRIVEQLITEYVVADRGIEIREIAGGFRMATKPEYHEAVRAFVKSLKPIMKLSPQALETLAVIAYKQPVTAPEVGEIRGVDSGGVLASLISRKLVTTAGRKQVIGRPILYKTTKEFLLRFGLKDVSELPSIEEFEKMVGELAESEALEADAMQEKAGVEQELSFDESADDPATALASEEEKAFAAVPEMQES